MRRPVRLHPAALRDTDEAAAWYAERSLRAAQRFLDELDQLIDAIAESPERFPIVDAEIRRALFRRFPYYIAFLLDATGVVVVAVAHGRRRPRFWRNRL